MDVAYAVYGGVSCRLLLRELLCRLLLLDPSDISCSSITSQVVSTCRRVFTACGGTLTEELSVTLRGVLAESAKPDNAVFRLLSTRLGEALALFVRNDVETGKDTVARCVPLGGVVSGQPCRAMADVLCSVDGWCSYGFRPFESQIAAAGTSLRRVLDHSVRVHGPMYSRLLLQHLQVKRPHTAYWNSVVEIRERHSFSISPSELCRG